MATLASARVRTPLCDIGNIPSLTGAGQHRHFDTLHKKPYVAASPKVDDKFKSNPLYITEYTKDIMESFRVCEEAGDDYMPKQNDISEKMRCVLVDWLVDVHLKFKLKPEVLYLAINLIDRYLAQVNVDRTKLQLVGVVGMLLAAKYEEIYPPEVKEFVFIAARTYSRSEILAKEIDMLGTLEFKLTVPTPLPFLLRGLQVIEAQQPSQLVTIKQTAQYLCELALVEYRFVTFKPSMVAACCIYLANCVAGVRDPWSTTLQHYMHLQLTEMQPCLSLLTCAARGAATSKFQAVRKKYSAGKYGQVACLVTQEHLPQM